MAAFLELIKMSVISVLTVPINPFFWFVVYLVYIQYRRIHAMETQVLGESRKTIWQLIRNSIVVGLLGGLLGTILIMILGITIDAKDFSYIFPLAILLMLINIRYICFSYAGGLLALSSLLIGVPEINVSSILAIVAILHMVEAVLIRIDGYNDALPIFIKDIYGEIVGGFSLNRFWPIPFAILVIANGPLVGSRDINLPEWWPLFTNSLSIENIALQILAIVAILGYGDMASTSTPKIKCCKSSIRLFCYSAILLVLSVLSTEMVIFKYLAALFAPIGHELLVIYGQREEKLSPPMFNQPSRGIRVLDIKRDSVGWKMNLKQGDILLYINNQEINSKGDIQSILQDFSPYIWMEVKDIEGKTRTLEYKDYRNGISALGAILVTPDSDVLFNPNNNVSLIKNLAVKTSEKYLQHKRKL